MRVWRESIRIFRRKNGMGLTMFELGCKENVLREMGYSGLLYAS
jgi:hypothetical protein